jgi:hypothetical protein
MYLGGSPWLHDDAIECDKKPIQNALPHHVTIKINASRDQGGF